MSFIISSCYDSDYVTPFGIEGVWLLEKSVGGLAGKTYFPETKDELILKISPGLYSEYREGKLSFQSSYEVTQMQMSFGTDLLLSLSKGGQYPVFISPDQMIIYDLDPDSFDMYFRRRVNPGFSHF